MTRAEKLKNAEDYHGVVAKELEYYIPFARELDLSADVLRQAAELAVRDGMYRHRESHDPATGRASCKNREQDCVAWNIRHFVDLTLVRACLLASSEEEMEKAESILMRLIED